MKKKDIKWLVAICKNMNIDEMRSLFNFAKEIENYNA
jgi:hypothetical protein